MLACHVGILTNEADEALEQALASLASQLLAQVEIVEITIIPSRPLPPDVTARLQALDPRIRLLLPAPGGDRTASINAFLRIMRAEIGVLVAEQIIPERDAVEKLVRILADPEIGMVGAHRVAADTPAHIAAYLTHLRLRLAHTLSLEIPRLRDMIAFRRCFDSLPPSASIAEGLIEAIVLHAGLRLQYAPDALAYSPVPRSLGDFLAERRSLYVEHLALRRQAGHQVASLSGRTALRLAFGELWEAWRLLFTLTSLALLETVSRLLGAYDYYVHGRTHAVWDIAWTTKRVVHSERKSNQERR
ncbi:MAG: hypothetical protein M5U01_41470 [Ardenticatenaceae bacterium]|nr:hypothetical protein [Ardenticatenaceae bacterium]